MESQCRESSSAHVEEGSDWGEIDQRALVNAATAALPHCSRGRGHARLHPKPRPNRVQRSVIQPQRPEKQTDERRAAQPVRTSGPRRHQPHSTTTATNRPHHPPAADHHWSHHPLATMHRFGGSGGGADPFVLPVALPPLRFADAAADAKAMPVHTAITRPAIASPMMQSQCAGASGSLLDVCDSRRGSFGVVGGGGSPLTRARMLHTRSLQPSPRMQARQLAHVPTPPLSRNVSPKVSPVASPRRLLPMGTASPGPIPPSSRFAHSTKPPQQQQQAATLHDDSCDDLYAELRAHRHGDAVPVHDPVPAADDSKQTAPTDGSFAALLAVESFVLPCASSPFTRRPPMSLHASPAFAHRRLVSPSPPLQPRRISNFSAAAAAAIAAAAVAAEPTRSSTPQQILPNYSPAPFSPRRLPGYGHGHGQGQGAHSPLFLARMGIGVGGGMRHTPSPPPLVLFGSRRGSIQHLDEDGALQLPPSSSLTLLDSPDAGAGYPSAPCLRRSVQPRTLFHPNGTGTNGTILNSNGAGANNAHGTGVGGRAGKLTDSTLHSASAPHRSSSLQFTSTRSAHFSSDSSHLAPPASSSSSSSNSSSSSMASQSEAHARAHAHTLGQDASSSPFQAATVAPSACSSSSSPAPAAAAAAPALFVPMLPEHLRCSSRNSATPAPMEHNMLLPPVAPAGVAVSSRASFSYSPARPAAAAVEAEVEIDAEALVAATPPAVATVTRTASFRRPTVAEWASSSSSESGSEQEQQEGEEAAEEQEPLAPLPLGMDRRAEPAPAPAAAAAAAAAPSAFSSLWRQAHAQVQAQEAHVQEQAQPAAQSPAPAVSASSFRAALIAADMHSYNAPLPGDESCIFSRELSSAMWPSVPLVSLSAGLASFASSHLGRARLLHKLRGGAVLRHHGAGPGLRNIVHHAFERSSPPAADAAAAAALPGIGVGAVRSAAIGTAEASHVEFRFVWLRGSGARMELCWARLRDRAAAAAAAQTAADTTSAAAAAAAASSSSECEPVPLGSLLVSSWSGVCLGHCSPTFSLERVRRSYGAGTGGGSGGTGGQGGEADRADRCLSVLLASGDSLDLEAQDMAERDGWAAAFAFLHRLALLQPHEQEQEQAAGGAAQAGLNPAATSPPFSPSSFRLPEPRPLGPGLGAAGRLMSCAPAGAFAEPSPYRAATAIATAAAPVAAPITFSDGEFAALTAAISQQMCAGSNSSDAGAVAVAGGLLAPGHGGGGAEPLGGEDLLLAELVRPATALAAPLALSTSAAPHAHRAACVSIVSRLVRAQKMRDAYEDDHAKLSTQLSERVGRVRGGVEQLERQRDAYRSLLEQARTIRDEWARRMEIASQQQQQQQQPEQPEQPQHPDSEGEPEQLERIPVSQSAAVTDVEVASLPLRSSQLLVRVSSAASAFITLDDGIGGGDIGGGDVAPASRSHSDRAPSAAAAAAAAARSRRMGSDESTCSATSASSASMGVSLFSTAPLSSTSSTSSSSSSSLRFSSDSSMGSQGSHSTAAPLPEVDEIERNGDADEGDADDADDVTAAEVVTEKPLPHGLDLAALEQPQCVPPLPPAVAQLPFILPRSPQGLF